MDWSSGPVNFAFVCLKTEIEYFGQQGFDYASSFFVFEQGVDLADAFVALNADPLNAGYDAIGDIGLVSPDNDAVRKAPRVRINIRTDPDEILACFRVFVRDQTKSVFPFFFFAHLLLFPVRGLRNRTAKLYVSKVVIRCQGVVK